MSDKQMQLYREIFSILIEKKKKEKTKRKGVPTAYNKPRRIKKGEPGYGKKKFVVNARNKSGKTKVIRFGDANLEIKRDSKKRRDSFRARHNCANAKDILTAKYWSCKQWRKKAKVMDSKIVGNKNGKMITESIVKYEYLFENAQFINRYNEYLAKERDPVISGYKSNFEARKEAYKAVLSDLKREYTEYFSKEKYSNVSAKDEISSQYVRSFNDVNTISALLSKCKDEAQISDFERKYLDRIYQIADKIDFQNPAIKESNGQNLHADSPIANQIIKTTLSIMKSLRDYSYQSSKTNMENIRHYIDVLSADIKNFEQLSAKQLSAKGLSERDQHGVLIQLDEVQWALGEDKFFKFQKIVNDLIIRFKKAVSGKSGFDNDRFE